MSAGACTGSLARGWSSRSRGRRGPGVCSSSPHQLVEELRAHRDAQLAERAASGGYWTDHGLVFTNEVGGPLDDRNDYRSWVKLLQSANVRRIRLHDGRHTAATLLLAEGVHPRVVMELLGHSAMRTTTDTYSHVMPALAQQAADKIGTALWGAPEPAAKIKKKRKGRSSKRTATKTATKNDEGPHLKGESPGHAGGGGGPLLKPPHATNA